MSYEPSETLNLRSARDEDAAAICRIYNHYILETVVTFEEERVTPQDIKGRIGRVRQASLPWLVAERGDEVLGYAYAGRWRERSAFRFSVEVAVYLAPSCIGQGIGTLLFGQILSSLRDRGIHVVISGIALPNESSIALHEKFGFEKVGRFKEAGFKFDRWIDVDFWQLML